LHPGDLKPSVAKAINELLDPVRKHFENDPYAKALVAKIKTFRREPPKQTIEEN
jgi:tyrosyl-tRNA synthetase